jgi:hypothetical protein
VEALFPWDLDCDTSAHNLTFLVLTFFGQMTHLSSVWVLLDGSMATIPDYAFSMANHQEFLLADDYDSIP